MKTKKQRIDEWTEKIDKIEARYKDLDGSLDKMAEAGCLDIDGPLFDAIWKSFGTMLEMIDPSGWIDWWLSNSCAKTHPASQGNVSVIADTSHKLAKLIVAWEDQNV